MPTAEVIQGDCLTELDQLDEQSVQTCVTSPPYWNMRNYNHPDQLGQEPTPQEYINKLVEVFRKVRRKLTNDGTLWLNLGDSYNGQSSNRTGQNGFNDGRTNRDKRYSVGGVANLKPKDLVGIPWRVALALQQDGWWLRQDIIWHKPNPMPESVTDRCTKAHEYIFLLSKSRRYYFDHKAIQEKAIHAGQIVSNNNNRIDQMGQYGAIREGLKKVKVKDKRNKRSVWNVAIGNFREAHFAVFPIELIKPCIKAGSAPDDTVLDPFAGAGTTLITARGLGRHAVGIEINPEYCDLIRTRIKDTFPWG